MRYLTLFIVFVPAILFAQIREDHQHESSTATYVEFVKIMDPDGTIRCVEYDRTQAYMDKVAASMSKSGLRVIPQTVGRRHADGRLMKIQTGLDIVLRGTQQLIDNPAAVAAFAAAAARWEARLNNAVTVTMDVDYGPTRFGEPWSSSNVLGSTSSAIFSLNTTTWRQYANALIVQNPQYSNIYNNIPDTLYNSTSTVNPRPSGTLANLQALGFRHATDALSIGSAPSIGFNSNFTFDLDPTNGITPGQTDFDGVAVHEIGHALGFVSVIGSTGTARTWDIFRFRPGIVKDTLSFRSSTRILTPGPSTTGGDHVFWDGNREWELSTATGSRIGGDGQQASHWRDDALRTAFPAAERKIGIMDPNIAAGVRDTISLADFKALSLMGWKIDFGNLIYPVEQLTTSSDYQTPTAVQLQWKNPSRDFGGFILTNFKIVIFRNGVFHKEIVPSSPGSMTTYIDSNLTQYQLYTYKMVPVHIPSGDSGVTRTVTGISGGSPRPGTGKFLEIKSNQSSIYVKFQSPSVHDDNTKLHNLQYAKFYRNTASQPNLRDSLMLTNADTGKIFYYIDTPGPRFLNNYTYLTSYVGAAPFLAEGTAATSSTVKAGIVSQSAYTENFEISRSTVITDDGWDSSNVAARSGNFSFGILNYQNNYSGSAYIPMIRGNGAPMMTFWTVCRIEPNDSALVQVSKNRGATWKSVLSLNENSHSEWQSGTNTWFRKEIQLTGFETDTILVRFQLKTDNANTKFGWLIDDITLSPVLTSVSNANIFPNEYSLEQNFPNPFNPSTYIRYSLKENGFVRIKVYDILGKEVSTLVEGNRERGWYQIPFNATALTSGVYFYRIDVNGYSNIKKMTYIQ